MSTNSRGIFASVPLTAALMLGSMVASGGVLATGTCKGNATEYQLPAEQQTVDPLGVYDLNGDGTICVAAHGRKTTYSDNRI